MKVKQNSFVHNSKRLSTYRPNSSTKNSKFPGYTINKSFSDLYPPIITLPSQKKHSKIGSQITREELYDENIHLKDRINKIRKELDETKSKLFKRGLELDKKEKIIRDCSKENVTEYNHEMNIEKAKESALLTLCKKKYNEMKIEYKKKCEENEILKANIKITKKKEYEIQIDVLKKEMEKIKNLYKNCQINYEKCMQDLNQKEELKKEFLKQHSIISSLNEKNKELYDEISYMQKENTFLKNELNKYGEKEKKLKKNNMKLKMSNEKYMNLKKKNENSVILNNDNIRKLNNLKKDLAEYKLLNTQLNEKYNNLLKNKGFSNKVNNNIFELKPFNYDKVKYIEKKEGDNQSQLYKSLLEEAKIKISILENYLRENDINPEIILKNKGYEGIINMNTNKNTTKLQKLGKTSTNNSTNTKDATSVGTKENADLSKNLNNTQSNFENINKPDMNKNNNNIINNEINNEEKNDMKFQ